MKLLYPRTAPAVYALKSKAICFVFLFCTVISFSSFTGNTNAVAHTNTNPAACNTNNGTPGTGNELKAFAGDHELNPKYYRIIILGLQVVLMPAFKKRDKDNDISLTEDIKTRLGLNKLIYC